MSINVKGVWFGSKYAILAMRENKPDPARGLQTGGSIINVASFVAIMGAGTPQLACESYSRILVLLGPNTACRYCFQGRRARNDS
jgi:NAD(P)-dependent dehydrogenase (short-subunit alcohol dehydrogenase family)